MEEIQKLNLDILLNCILVNENIRPAMLVQPANYGEATGKDPKTKHIIEEIKKYFPELIQSETYEIYQGIIISKTDYNGQDISLEKMGEILGYPCYRDFETINRDQVSYVISIYAILQNGNEIQIFTNACKDETNLELFKLLARKAQDAFNLHKYKHMLDGTIIKNVKVVIQTDIPVQQVINNLIKNNNLKDIEADTFINVLYNFGFSEKLLDYKFQYNNPIHRGIILELLLREQYDTLSPFYPIQKFPTQQREIDQIIEKYEIALLDILERTKIPTRGGKRKNITKSKRKKLIRKTKVKKHSL